MSNATVVGSIAYDLDLDDKSFQGKLTKASNEVQGFKGKLQEAEQSSQAFGSALFGLGVTALGAIGFGVKIAGDLESARQGFVALLGSAEKADETMKRIKKEASATPFELTGLVAGTQALTAITKDGNKAIDILLDVGKAIATSGKGQAELDRVILNLQQISATGQVTAMDIKQFQGAIPMFNDIIKAAGLTTEELQSSEKAADLLFDAFEKAGKAGGITANGFASQAGTWNQLWSNFVDNITIGSSELVKSLGFFDMAKDAIKGLTSAIALASTPQGIEVIKGFMQFIADIAPVISGAIIGGLVPAFVALAMSMLPILPFIAIGAALGLVIQQLIAAFGGWDNIMKTLQPTLQALSDIFAMYFLPLLNAVSVAISTQLNPELKKLWDIIAPVLIPALQFFAAVLLGLVLSAILGVIAVIYLIIITMARFAKETGERIKFVIDLFRDLPGTIQKALAGLSNILISPFDAAWKVIEGIIKKIRDGMDFTKRHSPSVLDIVSRGVDLVNKEFSSLADITMPSVSDSLMQQMQPAQAAGSQTIYMNIDKVGGQQDVNAMTRELGFRQGLIK